MGRYREKMGCRNVREEGGERSLARWRLGDRLWSQVVKIYGLEGVTYFIFVFV